jgi:hypothetical protein
MVKGIFYEIYAVKTPKSKSQVSNFLKGMPLAQVPYVSAGSEH